MKWKKEKIGDYCDITSSKRVFFSDYVDSGIPFFRSKEIIEKSESKDISEPLYISKQKYLEIKQKYGVPRCGDMLLTSVGTIGIPYLVKSEDVFYFKDGNLTWFKDFSKDLLSKYLFYWIRSKEGQGVLNNSTIGSSQKALTIAALKKIEIPLPPIRIQYGISSVLSFYDSLIENNQKQIKLLEEAAQRLYKEWFVDLRFPGHETTTIIDGMPKGWIKDRADLFFDITIGKTPPRAESQWFVNNKNGIQWVSISDMGKSGAYIFETAEGLTTEAVEKYNVKIIPVDTVLVSFKLTVGRVSITTENMCTNEAIAHFRVDKELRDYTYLYLKSFEYDNLGNTSAISKAVNSKIIKAMPFIMPDKSTLINFERLIAPIMNEIYNKSLQIKQLTEARDRLLPKLMSGEIEV